MLCKSRMLAAALVTMLVAGSTASAQVTTAFSYQGQLKTSGNVVNSATDMQFSLWTLAVGGTQIGSTVTSLNVPVSNGLFSVPIDFGVNPYASSQNLYLQVAVRNPAGSGSYSPMGSRQLLTPAPFSLATRGINVNAAGNVGIGSSNPVSRFQVRNVVDGGLNDPTAIFTSGSCGAPCGQENYHESVRLINDNANGQTGLGFMVEPNATINSVSDVWIGTGFGADAGDQANNFIIATKTGATTLTNRLVVDGDTGNVGIGTQLPGSPPTARLQVVGNTRLNGDLRFGNDNENGNTIRLSRFNGPANFSNMYFDFGPNITTNSAFIIQRNGGDIYQFNMDGNATKPGGGSWGLLSDERTKNDIQPLAGTLDRLLKLKGHSYTYKDQYVQNGRALSGMQIGLLAQEVEAVFPDWVSTGPDGLKMVTERSTTAIMVEAMRDLRNEKDAQLAQRDAMLAQRDAKLEELAARMEKLEALLASQAATPASARK